jgi:hypothetical protein
VALITANSENAFSIEWDAVTKNLALAIVN